MLARALLLTTVFATGCLTRGSGNIEEETRPLDAFSRIETGSSMHVTVLSGSPSQVVVSADDNLMPMVETDVVDGTLRLKMKGSFMNASRLTAVVTTPTMDAAEVSGSGKFVANDINSEDFHVDIAGSGSVVLGGAAPKLTASLSGSGSLDSTSLSAATANISVAGSGSAKVSASKSLDAAVTGSGSVRYSGNPADVEKSVSGSGSVRPL